MEVKFYYKHSAILSYQNNYPPKQNNLFQKR